MGEVEKSLGKLAEEINAEHRASAEAVTSALEHAIVAGGMLSEVKAGLPHGAWGSWVEGNFEGSARTAQAYMRLHRRRDEIRNGAADLSVRGILRRWPSQLSSCPRFLLQPFWNGTRFLREWTTRRRSSPRPDALAPTRRTSPGVPARVRHCRYGLG